jgi:hypothetical protein
MEKLIEFIGNSYVHKKSEDDHRDSPDDIDIDQRNDIADFVGYNAHQTEDYTQNTSEDQTQ